MALNEFPDFLKKYEMKLPLVVFILAFAIYANTLTHQMALDDYSVIVKHSHVQNGFEGIDEILTTNYRNGNAGFNDGLYRPLSLVLFAIEKELFNSNTTLAHLLNVLLYSFACLLLFFGLKRIFFTKTLVVPLGICLLFITHPLHTEIVANIKGRDELLAFFGLAACLLFTLKYFESKQLLHLILADLFFILALFSKESAVTYSILIPLLLFMRPDFTLKKSFKVIGNLLPLAIGFILLREYIIGSMPNAVDPGNFGILNNPIAATTDAALKWGSTFDLQLLFLKKLLLPFHLLHDYSYNLIPVVKLTSIGGILGLLVLLSLVGLAIWGVIKKNIFGILAAIYLTTIIVSSQLFITIGVQFAERMLFLAVLPFSILLVLGVESFMQVKKQFGLPQQKNALVLIGAISLVFGGLTISRNADWKNNLTLYSADIKNGSESARINYNYGSELYNQGMATNNSNQKTQYFNTAITHLRQAILIYPKYLDAYNNLGLTYKNLQDYDQSAQVFRQGIKQSPNYSKYYYNLGMTFIAAKNYSEAEKALRQYTQRQPNNAAAFYFLGEAAGYMGDFTKAVTYLNQSVSINSNDANTYNFLGMAYGNLGNVAGAEQAFLRAHQLAESRTDILMNLAVSYRNQGKFAAEKSALKKLLYYDPDNAAAKNRMAQL